MSLFGKVQKGVRDALSEETVRVLEDVEDTETAEVPAKVPVVAPKAAKEKKSRGSLLRRVASNNSDEPKAEKPSTSAREEVALSESVSAKNRRSIDPILDDFDDEDDVFGLGDDDSFDYEPGGGNARPTSFDLTEVDHEFISEEGPKLVDQYADVPSISVREQRVTDVLEVLQVPDTFVISGDVYLPGDLETVSRFDIQTPYGYEQGQVEAFVERVRYTIEYYIDLLKMRNEHVAKLATVVDKMQIEAANQALQRELINASSISMMSSSETEELETEVMESRVRIKNLEEQIRELKAADSSGAISDTERRQFLGMQDEMAVLLMQMQNKDDEIEQLRLRVAELTSESADDPMISDDESLEESEAAANAEAAMYLDYEDDEDSESTVADVSSDVLADYDDESASLSDDSGSDGSRRESDDDDEEDDDWGFEIPSDSGSAPVQAAPASGVFSVAARGTPSLDSGANEGAVDSSHEESMFADLADEYDAELEHDQSSTRSRGVEDDYDLSVDGAHDVADDNPDEYDEDEYDDENYELDEEEEYGGDSFISEMMAGDRTKMYD